MADIFLSYARVDLPRARQIERALEHRGWSVFWDRELLPGEGYRRAIEHELNQARCVIVLWSRDSIQSEWVIDEAESGKQRGRLVSVRIDDVEMPLGFRQLQAATLTGWTGDLEDAEFELLTRHLRACMPFAAGAAAPPEIVASAPARGVEAPFDLEDAPVWLRVLGYTLASALAMAAILQLLRSFNAAGTASAPTFAWRGLATAGIALAAAGLGLSLLRHGIELVAAVLLVRKLRND